MIYKILNYGFPVYLMLFEMSIRSLLVKDENAPSIIGPSLATSGLGLIISALDDSKNFESGLVRAAKQAVQNSGQGDEVPVTDKTNTTIRGIAIACLLLGIWGWCTVCVKTLAPGQNDVFLVNPTVLGCLMYLVGIVVLTLKERY